LTTLQQPALSARALTTLAPRRERRRDAREPCGKDEQAGDMRARTAQEGKEYCTRTHTHTTRGAVREREKR
jgi:hypothetical protein